MKITAKRLTNKLDHVNEMFNVDYDLNYSSAYGGWQLTSHKGAHVVQHRISGKEMLAYLDGMIMAYFITEAQSLDIKDPHLIYNK